MTLILNGTDNSATTPAVTGTDTDTGVYYPATNQVALATNGTQALLIDSTQNVLLSATSPGAGFTGPQLVVGKSANPYGIIEIQGAKTGSDGASGLLMFYNSSGSSRLAVVSAERTGADNSGALVFTTFNAGTGGEVGRFNKNGVLSLAGASTTATGVGIAFPATQSASTDANTLDDYEEGTWTPTFTNLGTVTIIQTPRYVKVGPLVWCYLAFTVTSTPTANSSRFTIPFTSATYSGGTWTKATAAGGLLETQVGTTCYFSTTAPNAADVFYCTFTFSV